MSTFRADSLKLGPCDRSKGTELVESYLCGNVLGDCSCFDRAVKTTSVIILQHSIESHPLSCVKINPSQRSQLCIRADMDKCIRHIDLLVVV